VKTPRGGRRTSGRADVRLLVGALALLGLVLAAVFLALGGGPRPRAEPASASSPSTAPRRIEEPGTPEAPRATPPGPAGRELVEAPPPEVPAAKPEEALAVATLEARVVDTYGSPLEGARVRGGGLESGTDATGRVTLRFEPPSWRMRWTRRLEVALHGYATRFVDADLESGRTTRLGDLVLHPGGTLVGRVVDGEKRGIEGANVQTTAATLTEFDARWARFHGPGGDRGPTAVSASDGAFRIEGMEPGFVRVWASAEGTAYSFSPPIEIRAGEESPEVLLVLEPLAPEDRIEGIVLSPDGAPVARANLQYEYHTENMGGSGSAQADERGRFRLVLYPRAPRTLRASDPVDRWTDAVSKDVPPGTLDAVLQLSEPRWIEVSVRDAAGESIERFGARTYPSETAHQVGSESGERHEGGVARLRVPPEPFVVCVFAKDFEESDQGPFDRESAPASLECSLRPLPGVSGRAFGAGEPLPHAKLALHRLAGPGTRIERNGFPVRIHPTPSAEGEADAEGRFRLTLREDGRFLLRASAEGFADGEAGPFDLRTSIGARGLEVFLGRGGNLEGRVIPAPGRDVAGVVVAVHRGDTHPQTVRVGPDGRYRFERLTPGRWMVEERDTLLDPSFSSTGMTSGGEETEVEIPWVCEAFEGQTTTYDLDLAGRGGRTLAGQLLLDGLPAGGWTAQLRPASGGVVITGRDRQSAATDREGRFTIPIPPGDRFRLTLESDPGAPGSLHLTDVVVPRGGETTWRLDLPTGSLEGERPVAAPGATDVFALLWSGRGEVRGWIEFALDADGRFALPRVPAGRIRIVRRDRSRPHEDPSEAPTEVEGEVFAGRATRLTLPP